MHGEANLQSARLAEIKGPFNGYELNAQPFLRVMRKHQAAAKQIKPLMRILDDRLGDGPWLAGEHFTFGDLWTGHLLYRYQTLVFDKAETPNIDAYYARLTQRPAFAKHVMVDFEPLRMTR